ncbi:putative integral membrane protein [Rosellinia necatrix]|uniref:Putative integral membrane protein n=1 Tax=Rosellinia necatrix TaxID=77044 RepID=A0A1W2TLN5_ROSNE|nr:putative integral membrane protein [Rosellinia necatrix]
MPSKAEEHNIQLTLGVVISLLVLSIISFILRIWARFATGARLWWDDYWMFWVMGVCIAASVFDFLGLVYGSGVHQYDLPDDTATTFVRLLWVYMLIWATGVFSVKIGILLFYWRVFQRTLSFRFGALIVTFISTGIFLSNFFSFTFQCYPVQKFWEPDIDGSCINQNAFYLASAIINVFGDIAVLSLPLPIIWGLQASRNKKWSLSFLFLLGAFVVVASIFRIVAVTQIDPHDFSFTNVGGGLWSTVEVEVGFICANLPAVRPLLFKWFRYDNRNASGDTPKYNVSSKKGMRVGHVKLPSRNRGADLNNSSTEILAPGGSGNEIPLMSMNSRFNAQSTDKIEPVPHSDIVVRKDFDMSIDANPESSTGGTADHFVQITTAKNRVCLQGAADEYYGQRN